jgi:predicted O-methyltransferase YrrM
MAGIVSTTARVLPSNVKLKLRAVLKKALNNREDYTNVVLARLGVANEFAGYDRLLDYMETNKIYDLKGDFLEIGAFMGGGSAKLAKYAAPHKKQLIVIDVFDPNFDATKNIYGQPLNKLYRLAIGRKSQRDIFNEHTRFARNIVVYAEDSKQVKLPPERQLCFSFIDGNHDPDYVRNDFYLAWNLTVPRGVVAIHDYVEGGGDLPQVTETVDQLIEANKSAIRETCYMRESAIMVIRKQ